MLRCIDMPYLLALLALITASPKTPDVPVYRVYEQSISYPSAGYANPWEDVRLAVTLTSPSGKEVKIGGFYYEPDIWKFRFAPSEAGDWTWKAQITDKLTKKDFNGSFHAIAASDHGFVRVSPHNKMRLAFEDGYPYYPLGIGDCLGAEKNHTPFENAGLDGGFREGGKGDGRGVSFDKYLAAYEKGGFDLFRWSVDNCAFGLYDKIDPSGNVYKQNEGIWGDQLCQKLRAHDFRIYMAFFGFRPPFPNDSKDAAKMDAIKRYVEYVANRYGAYVDFWELMNEYPGGKDTIDDDWYHQIAGYLKSIDPYHHLVSTCGPRPDIAEIDINSPHWYERESEFDSDSATLDQFRFWKNHWKVEKPVIFGEQGNSEANWDTRSGVRMRLRTWTAFFNEGALVFWNTSFAKDYRAGAANMYLGPEERRYTKALQDFTRGFDPQAKMVGIEPAPKTKVRGFALSGPAGYALYVHNYIDHENKTSGVSIKIAPQFAGTATWIDPSTGKTLGTQQLPAGEQTVEAPGFITDVALKIVPNGAAVPAK
jgi:hypothetical protein